MIVFPQCLDCRHLHRGTPRDLPVTCDAFRDGVPEAILDGRHDHTKPFEGDHGILFEAVPDASPQPAATPRS